MIYCCHLLVNFFVLLSLHTGRIFCIRLAHNAVGCHGTVARKPSTRWLYVCGRGAWYSETFIKTLIYGVSYFNLGVGTLFEGDKSTKSPPPRGDGTGMSWISNRNVNVAHRVSREVHVFPLSCVSYYIGWKSMSSTSCCKLHSQAVWFVTYFAALHFSAAVMARSHFKQSFSNYNMYVNCKHILWES